MEDIKKESNGTSRDEKHSMLNLEKILLDGISTGILLSSGPSGP